MVHAKSMLGLMEPDQLAPFGYEVQDSQGVRDRLDTRANTTPAVNHITMINDRKESGVVTTLMFVLATGQAPVRAAASSAMDATTTSVVPPLTSQSTLIALLLSIITLVMAVRNRMRMSPMNATTRVTQ
eukprot:5633398-Amphidinium_carterae.1